MKWLLGHLGYVKKGFKEDISHLKEQKGWLKGKHQQNCQRQEKKSSLLENMIILIYVLLAFISIALYRGWQKSRRFSSLNSR